MIVVDTNVVGYFVIRGIHTPKAEALRRRDHDWHVPELFVHEWLNVATVYVHKKLLTRDQAVRVFNRGMSLVRVQSGIAEPVRIINLYQRSGCASYDCQFAALAEDMGVKLVTADQQLAGAFPDLAEDLTAV